MKANTAWYLSLGSWYETKFIPSPPCLVSKPVRPASTFLYVSFSSFVNASQELKSLDISNSSGRLYRLFRDIYIRSRLYHTPFGITYYSR